MTKSNQYLSSCVLISFLGACYPVVKNDPRCVPLEPIREEALYYTINDLPTHWVLNKEPRFSTSRRYSLVVEKTGKASSCKVLNGSEEDVLDKSVCLHLKRRAKYQVNEVCGPSPHMVAFKIDFQWDMKTEKDPEVTIQSIDLD